MIYTKYTNLRRTPEPQIIHIPLLLPPRYMRRREIKLLSLVYLAPRQLCPKPRVPQEMRRFHHANPLFLLLWQGEELWYVRYEIRNVG